MRECVLPVFCGQQEFISAAPCEASELVHFRKRIGQQGIELILKESIRINGQDSLDGQVSVDTTVQEKNITYSTDAKLHKKIIDKARSIAKKHKVGLGQSYTQTVKKLLRDRRFGNHPKNKAKAKKADKKIKTIAKRLVHELECKLPQYAPERQQIDLFKKVLDQHRSDTNKIYSLHEPQVCCISKGKEHQKYEFGSKASFVLTQHKGVIVGAMGFRNEYDGNTLEPSLKPCERLVGRAPKQAAVDRGY